VALTNGQKKGLHAAARQAGLTDDQRRIIQRGVGGHVSAADRGWTRADFIRVMAHYEREYCGGEIRGTAPRYWQDELKRLGPDDSLLWAIRREAKNLPDPMTDAQVDAFLSHMTGGAVAKVSQANSYWLSRLLDGLKALRKRREAEARAAGGDILSQSVH